MQEWSGREDSEGFSIFVRGDSRRYDPPGWSDVVSQVRQCQELSGHLRRTAAKLKVLSDAVFCSEVRLEVLRLVLEHHGFRRDDNAMVMSPSVLRAVLEDVFFATSKEKAVDVELSTELTACFLWQTFDRHRSATLTLIQAKTALAVLSKAFPSELFSYLAAEAADHDGQVGPRRLRPVLEALQTMMLALGEDVSYEFKDRRLTQVEAEQWMRARMGWATHLARLRASMREIWSGPCVICKQGGLQGQAFLCQKCPWYWACRRCVLAGRYTYGHRPHHPMKDFIAPPNLMAEIVKAGGRVVKKAFSRKDGSVQQGREPVGLIEVPPVLDAGPTEEPLWSLKMRLRNVVSQINEESRRIQASSEQWENLQDASRALEDHGQRLQALGMRLAGLSTEHQITSTPKGPCSRRPPEMSPIGGTETPLELSTVLQKRVAPADSRAPVSAALDKLQALLASTTGGLEESFGDNEQLERAAQELESLLGGVIAGIEGHRRP